MGTCDFFPQRTPNPPQSNAGQGVGEGRREEEKKKTFHRAQAKGPSVCPRQGWPSGPGQRQQCGILRHRHAPRRPRHLGAELAGAERKRPGEDGGAGMRPARTQRMPHGRPLGSGGAPAARGRRGIAQQAVVAAGVGRAHRGAGPT